MKNWLFLFIALALFFATCVSYDNAVIYHKNFDPGKNAMLRFDGSYSDTLSQLLLNGSKARKPVYFYANGSVYAFDAYITDLCNTIPSASWGNYLVKGDSITIEKFQLFQNNYDRVILKGLIYENKIHLLSRKQHREKEQKIDYWILFQKEIVYKADSTKNFTRIWPKYNK